ncbi:MAG: type II secretion system protein [bacterium]
MVRMAPKHGPLKAFTLVELMVVIGVITILVGVLMPAIQSATARAKATNCRSNLGQLFKAMLSYQNEHGAVPSPAHAETATSLNELYDGDPDNNAYTWRGKIVDYLATVGEEEERYKVFKCPSVRRFHGHRSFYGTNAYLTMHTNPEELTRNGRMKYWKLSQMDDHSNTLVIGENNTGHWAVKPQDPRKDTDFLDASDDALHHARHRDRSSWVCGDGSLRSMSIQEAEERNCHLWFDVKSKARE